MRKMKLKIIVKMRKRDSFKDNNDIYSPIFNYLWDLLYYA